MDFGTESPPRAAASAESAAGVIGVIAPGSARTAAIADEAISGFGIASSPSAPRAVSDLGESARAWECSRAYSCVCPPPPPAPKWA